MAGRKNKDWVSTRELCDRLGIGRTTLFRWVARGRVPRPAKFGHRTTRWSPAEVTALVEAGPQPPGTYSGRATRDAAARVKFPLRAKRSDSQLVPQALPSDVLGTISRDSEVQYSHGRTRYG